jgi:hypothetical protein
VEPAQGLPQIKLARADGGYAGKLVTWSKTVLKLTLEIVKRPDDLHIFKVLPRRLACHSKAASTSAPAESGAA